MAKTKKKPVASKPKKPAKTPVKSKASPSKKVSAKGGAPKAQKAMASKAEKGVKAKALKAEKKPTKEAKKAGIEVSKKGKPVPTGKAPVAGKAVPKDEANKPTKADLKKAAKAEKASKAQRDEDEFEEEEVFESYGDAIKLTPEDLEDPDDVYLTDAEGRRYCKVKDCDQLALVEGFCRFHYLALWKKIQTRKKILSDGKLEKYIEDLTSRYPDKYIEMIRRDLKTEKDFLSAIQELEIDDSSEAEFEDDSGFIEEVRGIGGRGRSTGETEGGGGGEDF